MSDPDHPAHAQQEATARCDAELAIDCPDMDNCSRHSAPTLGTKDPLEWARVDRADDPACICRHDTRGGIWMSNPDCPVAHSVSAQQADPLPDEEARCDYCTAFQMRDWETVGRMQEQSAGGICCTCDPTPDARCPECACTHAQHTIDCTQRPTSQRPASDDHLHRED